MLIGKKVYVWCMFVVFLAIIFTCLRLLTFFEGFFMISVFVCVILFRHTFHINELRQRIRRF